MLVLRGQAAIFGFYRPPVFHGADAVVAGVDHRFDGKGHARLQHYAAIIGVVVQHLRLFVETFADAVAAVLAHDGEVVRFDIFLNGAAQLAQTNARLHQAQRQVEALLGDLTQTLALNGRLADDKHLRGVAVVLVFNHGHVDVDDVAIFQQAIVAGNAVTHHFVNRDAN